MRLLNTNTLKFEEFVGIDIPKYAILSHTWGKEEIVFEDIQTDKWRQTPRKQGADKIENACRQAKGDSFDYIWIDTCCINKSSSAELSEAINSMFNWYYDSTLCYAHLSDVVDGDIESFKKSRWFTRGWTLQELIAPIRVDFFDVQWRKIGDRLTLLDPVVQVTGISRRVLDRGHHPYCGHRENIFDAENCRCLGESSTFRKLLSSFSVATRMSWAGWRTTTRVEDVAYSLLGLFDINMPLLYGEGSKAFQRLQEEIIQTSNDQSILANTTRNVDDLFPNTPDGFLRSANLQKPRPPTAGHLAMTLTNRCLNLNVHLCPCWPKSNIGLISNPRLWLGILDSVYSDDHLSRPAILLKRLSSPENDHHVFTRINPFFLIKISPEHQPDSEGQITISVRDGFLNLWNLEVRFDPKLIKMTNINLLVRPPLATWVDTELPPVRIKPTVLQQDGMAYQIRMSFPELVGSPDGHIRWENGGFLGVDDGSSHGFFVFWGFHYGLATEPWCKVLAWHEAVPNRGFIPIAVGEDGMPTIRLSQIAHFAFGTMHDLYGTLPPQGSQPFHALAWPGFEARAVMTPKTFLSQTVYELEISVRRTWPIATL